MQNNQNRHLQSSQGPQKVYIEQEVQQKVSYVIERIREFHPNLVISKLYNPRQNGAIRNCKSSDDSVHFKQITDSNKGRYLIAFCQSECTAHLADVKTNRIPLDVTDKLELKGNGIVQIFANSKGEKTLNRIIEKYDLYPKESNGKNDNVDLQVNNDGNIGGCDCVIEDCCWLEQNNFTCCSGRGLLCCMTGGMSEVIRCIILCASSCLECCFQDCGGGC